MDEGQQPTAQQAVWNSDAAEVQAIFQIKFEIIDLMDKWDLETIYWKLRAFRRELDAKLSDKENIEISNQLKNLEDNRILFKTKHIDEGNFFLLEETLYLKLCRLMKQHGIMYREGDDPRKAILRR